MKTLRLVLGDQLNYQHSWFTHKSDSTIYFMAEMKQETNYVTHHIQKVVAFFISMRTFADWLKAQGHTVIYYTLDHTKNQQNLLLNLKEIIKENNITHFEYLLPDEFRLDQQLITICKEIPCTNKGFDTEHFYTTREELSHFFKGKKQHIMEFFYRYMRKKHHLLMIAENTPEGGKWNFDATNRKKWKGEIAIPPPLFFNKNVAIIVDLLNNENVKTIGRLDINKFNWPTSREESLQLLEYFCEYLLPHFGDFQDAMDPNEVYLFHSRLSFAMNVKIISPKEVVNTVIEYWRLHHKKIDITQVEGFVRQIIGWREYMRGMYWKLMPDYEKVNRLENYNALPPFYWTGNTKMNCLKNAINNSLDNAYAHHIQRLMVTGNYALLTQTHPDEVDFWYLGIYIDAIQWVEITNTRGMSQWADGGLIATKPYVSSGSYINKMSNYCKGCYYSVNEKTGEKACPFNSLYWNFLDEKQQYFKNNKRMAMMFNLLQKIEPKTLQLHKERAQHIIQNPDLY